MFVFFFLIRGSMRKKNLETKETRETKRKMSAPARQSELAPAPQGEGGCCPDLPAAAGGKKVTRLRHNKKGEGERKGLVQGEMMGFTLEDTEPLKRRLFWCKKDDGRGEQRFLGDAVGQRAAMVGSAIPAEAGLSKTPK